MRLFAALACLVASTIAPVASTPERLTLGTYMTANEVIAFLEDEDKALLAVQRLLDIGISEVDLEIYRSGVVVPVETLAAVRDFLAARGFRIRAGIATVPGGDIGERQEGGLHWFNWEAESTQQDMKRIVRDAAPLFDTFIVDDFLCTGDVSEQSIAARGEQSWADYRCALMTRMGRELFVEPAKEANPDITVVLKYPQWYDRFHEFGYDTVDLWREFDYIWVGTETRGQYTQRFGFVQPYQGFVNFRWMQSVTQGNVRGAWFDFGDCTPQDYVEQAYQTVLAGARTITLFHFGGVMEHDGALRLRDALPELNALMRAVQAHPVRGPLAFKPPNSDPGDDRFLFDYIGMLGVPLVPVAALPEDPPPVLFLSRAARDAMDDDAREALRAAGTTLVVTEAFLGDADTALAEAVLARGEAVPIDPPLKTYAGEGMGTPLLSSLVDGVETPFFTRTDEAFILRTFTFTQADYDAVGEVLLPPKLLGLLEIPRVWVNEIRDAFTLPLGYRVDAPTRVTVQPLGPAGTFVINYNEREVTVIIERLDSEEGPWQVVLPPRSHTWLEETILWTE